jgi:hypothetical protein
MFVITGVKRAAGVNALVLAKKRLPAGAQRSALSIWEISMKARSLTEKDLRADELVFIKQHRISISEVVDVTGMARIGQKRVGAPAFPV